MKQNILITSISSYSFTEEGTNQVKEGKTAFYIIGDDIHPGKISANQENGLSPMLTKTGIYEATFDFKVNTKGQMQQIIKALKFVKDFSFKPILEF